MAERVLSTQVLNRALLARQLLLERADLSVARALERVGGLQTQYAPSAYIGLWSRLRGFRREMLTRALEQRLVVQATLMRATIHMVSARDFPLLAAAVRNGRRDWWLRVQAKQLKKVDTEAAASRVRKHLSKGPRRQAELVELLKAEGFPPIAVAGAGMWVDLVRVPPSGTWEQRRADLYGLADGWLDRSNATEAEGMDHLIRRYLGAFGPASLADLASWAGLPTATVRPVMEQMELNRFRDEQGGVLFDLARAPLPAEDTPAPVRFLPQWDATLLGHTRRTGILPEPYRSLVFNTKTPQSVSTFLVDGVVAGKWRYQAGRVHLEPFERIPASIRRELEEEGKRLAGLHA
ncbi:MAG TPA: winged helix DNA-binding domain-containing protein [Anaerolineales bacterium]